MSHWRAVAGAQEVQNQEEMSYYGGWTISGLAVLATIGAVWVMGI